jgi:hypothetical protein
MTTKKQQRIAFRLTVGAAAVLVAFAARGLFPEMVRYLRIRRM